MKTSTAIWAGTMSDLTTDTPVVDRREVIQVIASLLKRIELHLLIDSLPDRGMPEAVETMLRIMEFHK